MSMLAVLAFATPIFGFALTPPPGVQASPPPGSLLRMPIFAQLEETAPEGEEGDAEADVGSDESEAEAAPPTQDEEEAPRLPPIEEVQPAPEDEAEGDTDMSDYAGQMRQRAEVRNIHRAFGIATWGAMLVTAVLGFIQYYNLYGFFGSAEDTPCVQGTAVFGQDQCWGTPWAHRVGWITTTALYTTTFTLSFLMPDPDNASEGSSAFAQNLSMHKTLRWVHLAGMLAQIALGVLTSQAQGLGLDRANNFGELQAMASVHQLIGWTTLGVLTAAGAIMVF